MQRKARPALSLSPEHARTRKRHYDNTRTFSLQQCHLRGEVGLEDATVAVELLEVNLNLADF